MLIKAKKSLGQNFLRSKSALYSIIQSAELNKKDIVLEIGPGEGVLTQELINNCQKLICIEKDDRLIEYLKNKFAKYNNFEIIHQDIKNFDFDSIKKKYKIVANIPYYLTGLILRKIIDSKNITLVVLLVQKEVAERITKNKKENLLSLSIKTFGEAKYIKQVPRGSFVPSPKVDSAIIKIQKHQKDILNKKEKKYFFDLIHASFKHKRKTLGHNLKIYNPNIDWQKYVDLNQRAEDVDFDSWRKITRDTINLWD